MATEATAPDDVLIRCKQGDKSAFREVFARYRQDVARLIFRMVGPGADLEDLIQDVFVQVFRSIGDFRGESRFSTWLHRLTVNVVLMHRRAARVRPALFEELSPELEGAAVLPDEDAIRRERLRMFYDVLNRLTEKKRTVFVLHEIEGIELTEIAKIIDAPLLTVRTRLFYARRDIIQLLREEPSLAAFADIMLRHGSADLAISTQAQGNAP